MGRQRARTLDLESYPREGSFAELLKWHWDWGTRPDCSTVTQNQAWKMYFFADAIRVGGLSQNHALRKIRNWVNKGMLPDADDVDTVKLIFDTLFGKNTDLAGWSADLKRALERDRAAKPKGGARHSVTVEGVGKNGQSRVPLATSHFVGRADEVNQLAAIISADDAGSAVLLQGGPGIGKTELTKAIAHHEQVAAHFAERRWFIQLETASTADAMRDAIARRIGCDPAQGFPAALAVLAEKPSLLVLDNLETPWEPINERRATEQALAELAQTPGLAILASFRGRDWLKEPNWLCHLVEPLDVDACIDLLSQIAGRWTLDDPHRDLFLNALGGLPLAIELVGRRAHGRSKLEPLWREWSRIGADLATNSDFAPGPQTSLASCIELSLRSTRMMPSAHRLFQILGVLPGGLSKASLSALMGDDALNSEEGLLKVGLAIERNERIDLLPPIREHAFRHHKIAEEDAISAIRHFCDLETHYNSLMAGDEKAKIWFDEEFPNIENTFKISIVTIQKDIFMDSAQYFHMLSRQRSIPTDVFRYCALHIRSRSDRDIESEAKFLYFDGSLALYKSRYEAAGIALNEALFLFNQTEDARGKACCLQELALLSIIDANPEGARQGFEEARLLFQGIGYTAGEAECTARLGEVALEIQEYDQARNEFSAALSLFRQIGSLYGEAICIRCLGAVAVELAEYEVALSAFDDALHMFRRVGGILGELLCHRGFGDVAFARLEYEAAQTAYKEALLLSRSLGVPVAEANCLQSLGNVELAVSGPDSARSLYQDALEIFRRAGDVLGESKCVEKLRMLQ
jgi:tetratricopeptide (TPR) repeat protein